MLSKIVDFFSEDPLRLLYVIGGSGGIMYWWDRLTKRPKLAVRINMEETIADRIRLNFEVENRSHLATSLEQEILFRGYNPKIRTNVKTIFVIDAKDRNLSPYAPKEFEAWAEDLPEYYFLWFKTYIFRPTKGRKLKIRVRSAHLDQISFLRFYYELILLHFLQKVPQTKPRQDKTGPPGPSITWI